MYKLYSQRKREAEGKVPDVYEYDYFSQAFRNQYFHIVSDAIAGVKKMVYSRINFDLWELLCDLYSREKGLKCLKSKYGYENNEDAYEYYIDSCDEEDFLDILDYSCHLVFNIYITLDLEFLKDNLHKEVVEPMVQELNYRFKQHSLGYELINGNLIRIDNEHIHSKIVKPALLLLHNDVFSGAEEEYLKAWEHYKKRNKKDAILNAGKAFESVMKTICKKKGYAYDEHKDDAKKLIQVLRENDFFPSYLESQMNGIRTTLESGLPTVRNKTAGHGQGTNVIEISDSYVSYAMNLTATNIVFLCNLYMESNK